MRRHQSAPRNQHLCRKRRRANCVGGALLRCKRTFLQLPNGRSEIAVSPHRPRSPKPTGFDAEVSYRCDLALVAICSNRSDLVIGVKCRVLIHDSITSCSQDARCSAPRIPYLSNQAQSLTTNAVWSQRRHDSPLGRVLREKANNKYRPGEIR